MLYDPHEEKLPAREKIGGALFALTLLSILVIGMLI